MDNALKGVLLSALVFPGLGQLVLKHTRRGIVLMLVVTAALAVIVTIAVRQALVILEDIERSGSALDPATVAQAASQASAAASGWLPAVATLVLVGCWVFAVLDAWRIGRHMDREPDSGAGAGDRAGGQ